MGKLIGDADQICGYGFSSTYLGNKAAILRTVQFSKENDVDSCYFKIPDDFELSNQAIVNAAFDIPFDKLVDDLKPTGKKCQTEI